MPKPPVKFIALAAAITAVWLIVAQFIRSLSVIIRLFSPSEHLQTVFAQLKTADISVPLWMPLIIGIAYSATLTRLYPAKPKWRGWLILGGIILFLLVLVITLYQTKVNGIPFGMEMKIAYDIFTSGALEKLS